MTKIQQAEELKLSWLAKYYPVPANKVKDESWHDCLKHSLRKWIGLRPANMLRHGLISIGGTIYARIIPGDAGFVLSVTDLSCALC